MEYFVVGVPSELVSDVSWCEEFSVEPLKTCTTLQNVDLTLTELCKYKVVKLSCGHVSPKRSKYCVECGAKVVKE